MKIEIIYKYTATNDFTNPQKPRFAYSLPLHHEMFVADCSDLPKFED